MDAVKEIRKQIAELEKQAKKLVEKEKKAVISDIREKIATYGLTASDLGLAKSRAKKKKRTAAKRRSRKKVQYRGPNGETWAGGRGRRPNWVVEIIEAGGDIEEYRV